MFKSKFDEREKKGFYNTDIVLPDGYIFKYRMGETTGIHYTGKNVISESDFNYTVKMIIMDSHRRELDELNKISYEKSLRDKSNYENLPEYIKYLCERRLKYEQYTMDLKNRRKRFMGHIELNKCIENGADPKDNYFDEIKGCFVYKKHITICESRSYVDYNQEEKVIFNAVVVKALIEEFINRLEN